MTIQKIETRQFDRADVEVGRLVRVLRLERGLTQRKLAKHIGVKFQQLQHYEAGRNSISMKRLTSIAKALGVDVIFLLGGGWQAAPALSHRKRVEVAETVRMLGDIGALRLLRAFVAIPPELARLRESIVRVLEGAAAAGRVQSAYKRAKRH